MAFISDNAESVKREMDRLIEWCQNNNLARNVSKTNFKEDPQTSHQVVVEGVNYFKFLGLHISKHVSWTQHIDVIVKKAHHASIFLEDRGYLVCHQTLS